MKTLILACFLSLLAFSGLAQTEAPTLHRELLLASSLQGNLNLVYKWETTPNRFWRLSGAFLRGNLANAPGAEPRINAGFGLSFGREMRLPVTDRVDFLHGPEFNLNVAGNWQENRAQFTLSPGLTYVLGAIYHVNESLYLGFEGGPSLFANLNFQDNRLAQSQFLTQFSTYQLKLTLGYRFVRFPKR